MENQHRKITGYRDLSPGEIALMNEIKAAGATLQALALKVAEHLESQYNATTPTYGAEPVSDPFTEPLILDTPEQVAFKDAERDRLRAAEPYRWAAVAKTDFQTGLMALTRAVAQPGSF